VKCPFCGELNTQVTDTREAEDGDSVRRRRRCGVCEKRFTTYERVELRWPHILKRSGIQVEYDRKKLADSMRLALRKRPVPAQQIQEALLRVEGRLLAIGGREVPSVRLGELVMDELKGLDTVAYVRFASVYRNFEDVSAFSRVIEEVEQEGAAAVKRAPDLL
jgi:transcriptional repressor NrdR